MSWMKDALSPPTFVIRDTYYIMSAPKMETRVRVRRRIAEVAPEGGAPLPSEQQSGQRLQMSVSLRLDTE